MELILNLHEKKKFHFITVRCYLNLKNPNIVKCLNYPDSDNKKCSVFQSYDMNMLRFVQICSRPN